MTLTIFCGTYNRCSTLERSILSYRQQTLPYRVIIVDNGSDDPASLAVLERVAAWPEVAKIYSLRKIGTMEELTENYSTALRDQFRRGWGGWFAVTDADICFDGSSRDTFGSYVALADARGWAVGPHTRVERFPVGYPLRSRILATESRLLYRASMDYEESVPGVPFSYWPIDTTFQVFPAEPEFRRLLMGTVRCGPPFDAMHLDWYVDVFRWREEDRVYLGGGGQVGAFAKGWIRSFVLRFLRDGPEVLLEFMLSRRRVEGDLCNTSFLISWLYQYGLEVPDLVEASRWLDAAVPVGSPWWELLPASREMIFEDRFDCLGWG